MSTVRARWNSFALFTSSHWMADALSTLNAGRPRAQAPPGADAICLETGQRHHAFVTAFSFWFEPASTYSYLTAVRIGDLARARGVAVDYRPFLLGPIFADQGWNTSPFNIYEAKGRYMWRDVARTAARLGLPWKKPSVFPRNGLLAARLAVVAVDAGFADRLVPAIYRASFERDEDIADRDVLGRLLTGLGQDPEARLAEAISERTKQRLREQTDRARELGIFGAPSFIVGGELFWGNDRLEEALDLAANVRSTSGGACGFPNDF